LHRNHLEFSGRTDQRIKVIVYKIAQHLFFINKKILTKNISMKNRCWEAVLTGSTGVPVQGQAPAHLNRNMRIICMTARAVN